MTALVKAKGRQSGWVRHHKRPFEYSSTLVDWEKSVKAGLPDAIELYAAKHERLFNYARSTH